MTQITTNVSVKKIFHGERVTAMERDVPLYDHFYTLYMQYCACLQQF